MNNKLVVWEGAEEWEPLAWELCADEHGEESCHDLIWDMGVIPEPWGERWQKYEDEAKRMIFMVRKCTHPVKDREADRLRFFDEAFNLWLDESISDSGHTVYDQIPDICCAWHGWSNREWYENSKKIHWEDREDEWSKEIQKAHPLNTGFFNTYDLACEMVGNRHGKFALIALVNWLLRKAQMK